jgi:hypothetical protein
MEVQEVVPVLAVLVVLALGAMVVLDLCICNDKYTGLPCNQ